MNNLYSATIMELNKMYCQILKQYGQRGYVHPVGGRAEYLIGRYSRMPVMKASTKGFDIADPFGNCRIEVKARIVKNYNASSILFSDFRNLDKQLFDQLACIAFRHEDLTVWKGFLIPRHIVLNEIYPRKGQQNAGQFYLKDRIIRLPGVQDITEGLKRIEDDEKAEYVQ